MSPYSFESYPRCSPTNSGLLTTMYPVSLMARSGLSECKAHDDHRHQGRDTTFRLADSGSWSGGLRRSLPSGRALRGPAELQSVRAFGEGPANGYRRTALFEEGHDLLFPDVFRQSKKLNNETAHPFKK
jgi:hypothetical protein